MLSGEQMQFVKSLYRSHKVMLATLAMSICLGVMLIQPPVRAETAERPLMQVGPWYPAQINIEEPYINIINASAVSWRGGGKSTQELYDQGVIDPVTGFPTRLPDGNSLYSGVYFTGNEIIRPFWDGDWVIEWDGDVDIRLRHHAGNMQRRISKNRIEFTRDYVGGRTPWHMEIQIANMRGPISDIRIFRKENEAALRAGKIYNPKFAEAVSRYDIVRSMDLQEINRSFVRSVNDLPGEGAPFWANRDWQNEHVTDHAYRSMPLHATFALATETDTALWTHAPITLGMPVDFFDPSIMPEFENQSAGAINTQWASAFRNKAKESANEILNSPEWDLYADQFVEALIESGYPDDRALYVTVANEVWNFSLQYFVTTHYAWGISQALSSDMGLADNQLRYGYGILSARWKLALDGALKRAGREQDVTYVLEGQAAWDMTSRWALSAAKAYLEQRGEVWDDHAPDFGISVASYWGHSDNYSTIGKRPTIEAQNKALEQFLMIGSAKAVGTKNQVVEAFRAHKNVGESFGVPFIGAYEGGSHLTRARDFVSSEHYNDFMWGEPGGRVNAAVNEALAEEFPGVILSNYGLAGPIGAPWFEGPLDAENPYARSWEPYLHSKN